MSYAAVQEAVTVSGVDSPEAAKAMREYAEAQTTEVGHVAPHSVWQPSRFVGVWHHVPADERLRHRVEGVPIRLTRAGR